MDSSHRSVGEETLSPVQFYKVFHFFTFKLLIVLFKYSLYFSFTTIVNNKVCIKTLYTLV